MLFILSSITLSSYAINEKDVFYGVRKFQSKKMPKDFVAVVNGDVIKKGLKKIPKREKINPALPMKVKFYYLKGYGETIKVANVSELYRDRYQTYISMYESFKAFLDPSMKYNKFKRLYDWKLIKTSKTSYIIKMRRKKYSTKNYYIIFFDKKNFSIRLTKHYKKSGLIGWLKIKYTKENKYYIPKKLTGYGKVRNPEGKIEKKKFTLHLSSYKYNRGIKKDCFFNDDCLLKY